MLGAATFVRAQQTPPTCRSGVNVVQLDVSVLDDHRRPVRGLTSADFTVLEDGKPREIVAFKPVELPARRLASTVLSIQASAPREERRRNVRFTVK